MDALGGPFQNDDGPLYRRPTLALSPLYPNVTVAKGEAQNSSFSR